MLKKNFPVFSCFSLLSRLFSAGWVGRVCLTVTALSLCIPAALAQADSLPVAGTAGQGGADSADIYLSTDSNTHDVSVSLNSLYVPDHQELRHIPASRIRSYKTEDSFAYANDPAYWRREPVIKNGNLNLQLYWRIFLVISGGFLAYGVYRLAKENFSGVFRRRSKKAKGDAEPRETEDEMLSPEALEKNLAAAIAGGDWSAAVRFHYLKLIRALQDRGMVPAGTLATNRAWSGVFADPAMARRFRSLSGAYEYVVYGGFAPDQQQYADLQKKFTEFSQTLPG